MQNLLLVGTMRNYVLVIFFNRSSPDRHIIWYIRLDVIIKIHSLLFSYESMTVAEIIQFT